MSLPLTAEQTTEYNNVATTPPTAPLGDIINELYTGGKYGPTGTNVDIFVDSATGNDSTGNGESFATAYATIERAVQDVADTDIEFTRFITVRCRGLFGADGRVFIRKSVLGAFNAGVLLGGLRILGEPNTLNDTRTLVSAAAGAESPLVALDIGVALSAPSVVGKTFIERTVNGITSYFPVVSVVGTVVSVVGVLSSFAAGQVWRVVDVGGAGATIQNADVFIDGSIDMSLFLITDDAVSANSVANTFSARQPRSTSFRKGPNVGGMCVDDSPRSSFFNNMRFSGMQVLASNPNLNGAFFDNINVEGAAAFKTDGDCAIQTLRDKIAVATKIQVRTGLLTLSGAIRFEGAGTAVSVIQGASLLNNFATVSVGAAGGLTRLYDVLNGSRAVFNGASHDGTVAGVSAVIREGSICIGLEASAGTLASTPAGSDVTVGALGTFTFALLPQTDPAELVRAT